MRRFVVITPVLNGEKYLEATLASLDAQDWDDWTHYVVDGGSTDATPAIVQRSMQNQPRRHFIPGPDRGLYDGILKGFTGARSAADSPDDILLWLNADDLLAPWAFSTMAQSFDQAGADWMTALPGQWDAQGRLVMVQPSAWYPQGLIRRGLFHGRCLGWIQQESTFFTRRLFDLVTPDCLEAIRATRVSGDFLLWREFARHRPLVTVPTVIGGFRYHGGNASLVSMEIYYRELRQAGALVPPRALGKLMRALYRVLALFATAQLARQQGRRIEQELASHGKA